MASSPNPFIGSWDAAFIKGFFDVTKAQAEAMIQPNCVADNFGREPRALVTGLIDVHVAQ